MIHKNILVAAPFSEKVKRSAVNGLTITIAGIALLIGERPLHAQRGSRWSASDSASRNSQTTGDFQKALAVEASETQLAKLRSWTQRTAALNRQLEDLRHVAKSRTSSDLPSELDTFKVALVADNLDRQEFLVSLSAGQQSVLDKPVRGLDRANDAMAKAFALISEGSGEAQNPKLLTKGLQTATKAIATEQHEQQGLAREMGVKV